MKRLLLVVATSVVMAVGLASPAAAAPRGPSSEACLIGLVQALGLNVGVLTRAVATTAAPGAVGAEVSQRAQQAGSEGPFAASCPGP